MKILILVHIIQIIEFCVATVIASRCVAQEVRIVFGLDSGLGRVDIEINLGLAYVNLFV